jgi:hypothetical protein
MALVETSAPIFRSPAHTWLRRIRAFWRNLLEAEERYAKAVSPVYVSPYEAEQSLPIKCGRPLQKPAIVNNHGRSV